ncbi:16897_t:CDS:1, partial [Racocetra fulgida]
YSIKPKSTYKKYIYLNMQATQILEYNIEYYTDDYKAGLEKLLDQFDQFVECLQEPIINSDHLFTGAVLIKYNSNFHYDKLKEN